MKINTITTQCKPYFKQNDQLHIFGIDEGGQPMRDYIRQWHDKYYIPYQSIYEKEGRKSEFEMKQIISDLVRKPVVVDNEKINKLRLPNIDQLEKTIYRGAMVKPEHLFKVKKLHEAGIRRIISIGSGFPELERECEKFGIEHLDIEFVRYDGVDAFKTLEEVQAKLERIIRDMTDWDEKESQRFLKGGIDIWKKNTRRFIDEFTTYIQMMQKGNVYMGCQYGTYNTDTAIMFDYLFNPKMNHYNGLNRYNGGVVEDAENLYHNLTDSDKLKMGWTKDFEEIFLQRLETLKNIVGY